MGEYVTKEVAKLGKPESSEKRVILVFGLTAFFWIFRAQINRFLGTMVLSDSLIATGSAILMFVVPAAGKKRESLLVWPDAVNLPWGILLLFGGGLSLAHGLSESGVIALIGDSILRFKDVPPIIIMTITVAIMLVLPAHKRNCSQLCSSSGYIRCGKRTSSEVLLNWPYRWSWLPTGLS